MRWNISVSIVSSFKNIRIKSSLLTNIDMLLMVEKCIRGGGIYHYSYWYAEANNKCNINYIPNKESSYPMYLDINDLRWWAMSQKSRVGGFQWVKKHLYLIKCYRTFFDVLLNILDNYTNYILIYQFLVEKIKIKKCKKLSWCTFHNKKEKYFKINSFVNDA